MNPSDTLLSGVYQTRLRLDFETAALLPPDLAISIPLDAVMACCWLTDTVSQLADSAG